MNSEALELLRRHSGLSLSADGVFSFHEEIVPHPRVQTLFHGGLAVREDGDVTLTVGTQWAFVACVGVARFVDSVGVKGDGLTVSLKGHGRAVCAPPVLAFAPDGRFYLWVDSMGLPAVLTRSAHQQLAGLLGEGADGQLNLSLAGREVPVLTLPRAPRAHEGFENL